MLDPLSLSVRESTLRRSEVILRIKSSNPFPWLKFPHDKYGRLVLYLVPTWGTTRTEIGFDNWRSHTVTLFPLGAVWITNRSDKMHTKYFFNKMTHENYFKLFELSLLDSVRKSKHSPPGRTNALLGVLVVSDRWGPDKIKTWKTRCLKFDTLKLIAHFHLERYDKSTAHFHLERYVLSTRC